MENKIDSHSQAGLPEGAVNASTAPAALRARLRSPRRRMRAFLRAGDSGNALVEFALILPVLLLLTTGVLIFGVAMNNYIQLTNAVSVGARTLVANAGVTTNPCQMGATAIENAAPALTAANMTFSFVFNGVAYNNKSTCSSASTLTGAAGNLTSGTSLTVTATYPLNLSVYGKVFNLQNAVLSATSTEFVQ
jgi:Flp pilus assembly protein TadG